MEWMNEIMKAKAEHRMEANEETHEKLKSIDKKIQNNMLKNIEKDRIREQKTLEMSRQYYIA